MSTHCWSGLLCLLGMLLSGCSGESSAGSSGFDSGCPAPAGVVLTKPQVAAAISAIKSLFAGTLSFAVDPGVARILTDSPIADRIVASLMCTAEKRGEITSTDTSRVEYTGKLFLYTWGTSPVPGPEDVQAWTGAHPYAHVIASPTLSTKSAPSAQSVPFATERFDGIDSASDTCTQHTIPAGVPVCVRLLGRPAAGLYAAEAHDHDLVLTAIRPGEPVSWFKQNVDYAVCLRPEAQASRDAAPLSAAAIEIDSRPREQCLNAQETGSSLQRPRHE